MKKGTLLLTALLTASFLVACENKGGSEQPQQQEQTQQEEQAPQQQEQTTQEQEQTTEEQATEEQTAGEENTGTEEGATQEENTTGENTENQGGEQSGEAQGGNNEQTQSGESAGGDVKKGQQLFTANGCTACHQEKADTVGPSLAKIAQAYAGKKEDLIKFLKGEGKAIVDPAKFSIMQPNLAKTKGLADGDLSALADYILSVK